MGVLRIAGIEIPSGSPVFVAIVAIHVPIGLLAVVSGVGAMFTEKRRGAHTKCGSVYFWSLGALFATSTALAAMRWSEDYHLFPLGARGGIAPKRDPIPSLRAHAHTAITNSRFGSFGNGSRKLLRELQANPP